LQALIEAAGDDALGLLTAHLDNPRGYGRIVRVDGEVKRIVEEKDADDAERAIREINTGILVAPTPALARWLPTLGNRNAQGEYYLTDIVALAVAEGLPVVTAHPAADLGDRGRQQQAAACAARARVPAQPGRAPAGAGRDPGRPFAH
jgi:bifunctional UDP-N-acetylglucosamine pyrophosphorylase/glucosamine-1-phosphate N-acetyltransferase